MRGLHPFGNAGWVYCANILLARHVAWATWQLAAHGPVLSHLTLMHQHDCCYRDHYHSCQSVAAASCCCPHAIIIVVVVLLSLLILGFSGTRLDSCC